MRNSNKDKCRNIISKRTFYDNVLNLEITYVKDIGEYFYKFDVLDYNFISKSIGDYVIKKLQSIDHSGCAWFNADKLLWNMLNLLDYDYKEKRKARVKKYV